MENELRALNTEMINRNTGEHFWLLTCNVINITNEGEFHFVALYKNADNTLFTQELILFDNEFITIEVFEESEIIRKEEKEKLLTLYGNEYITEMNGALLDM
jgi:hypothetical protein